jgi:hypothetical protein
VWWVCARGSVFCFTLSLFFEIIAITLKQRFERGGTVIGHHRAALRRAGFGRGGSSCALTRTYSRSARRSTWERRSSRAAAMRSACCLSDGSHRKITQCNTMWYFMAYESCMANERVAGGQKRALSEIVTGKRRGADVVELSA